VLDVDALRAADLEVVPFGWAFVPQALDCPAAQTLLRTFPVDGFWLIDGEDGEKSYTYAARPLVTLGADRPVDAPDLDPLWSQLALDLVSDAYRDALGDLIGEALDDALMEASIWRWDQGHQLGPHRDMTEKIATQVIYFSDEWRPEWGGTLRLLNSADPADVFCDVLPGNGSSSILVRSDHSWHAVTRITGAAPAPRRSVIVTWFRPGARSPVWTVDAGGGVRCTVGIPERRRSQPGVRPPHAPLPLVGHPMPARGPSASADVGPEEAHALAASPNRPPRIGMAGTFDVANVGDLLFPIIADHELGRRLGPVDLRLYSYRRMSSAAWPLAVESLGRLPDDVGLLDALLIGGGEIVHAVETIAPGYRPTDGDVHHPLGLWLTPTLLAAAAGVPVAWNAPSALERIPAVMDPLIVTALQAAAYAAVRDARSATILADRAPAARLRVVPDTVFGILSLLPPEPSPGMRRVMADLGIADRPYVVVQPTAQLAPHRASIRRLLAEAAAAGLAVVELPIGPIHGDAPGVLELPDTVSPEPWPPPLVIAEILARSEGVIAESLHAGIIAVAAGVPLRRPAPRGSSKHELLQAFPNVVALDADGAGLPPAWFGRLAPSRLAQDQVAELARHWDAIADMVRRGRVEPRRASSAVVRLVGSMPHLLEGAGATAGAAEAVCEPRTAAPVRVTAPTAPSRLSMSRGTRVHPDPAVSIIVLTLDRIELLERCLDSIDMHVAGRVAHETIVVTNGTSLERLHALQHRDDVVVMRSRVNRGFAGGCNWAARHARGRYLVFLNDDAEVTPRWLEYLVATAQREDVGAVGSRVLFPDGSLQESGSVLWNDGSAAGIGRGLEPASRAHMAVRDVDFCSACSLLVSREAWDAVGGMDEGYHPAYYEDADLCLRLRRAGYRVVVDPRSSVRHLQSASSDPEFCRFLHARNRLSFVARWRSTLVQHGPPPVDGDVDAAVRHALARLSGSRRRLLVIDDRLPDQGFGSGFGRMLVAITELARDHAITFLPSTGGDSSVTSRLAELGVDVVWEDACGHLERLRGWYDAILISRPHNLERCIATVRDHQPQAALVYDAEALWHRRLEREASLLGDDAEGAAVRVRAGRMRRTEERACSQAHLVVCLSPTEAATVRGWEGAAPVVLIPPVDARVTEVGGGFHGRRDIIFTAGWLAGSGSPNVDGLQFFARDVLPHLVARVPAARVVVTGGAPPPDALALEGSHIHFVGHVPDLSSAFAQARVAIVPIRFGSGVKIKTTEALQHGVPVVATTVGAEGIDCGTADPIAIHDDPEAFADAIARLLVDPVRWRAARERALRFARQSAVRGGGTSWCEALDHAVGSAGRGRAR
jgi:GT2 family glycosyltransferase